MTGTARGPDSARGFALRAAAWIVGLVALLRMPWVQSHALVPFAALQQRAAEGLTGISGAVTVDASCTGADAMALTFGAILAFPSSWRSRLLGCLAGLGLLTAVNTLRIGTLGAVARDRPLFDLMHVHLWPAALMLVAAGFVFLWMRRQRRPDAEGTQASPWLPAAAGRRALLLALAALAAYYLAAPLLGKSAWLLEVAGWCAATTGALASGLGLEAQVQGNYFFTASGKWIVTQSCILTPLIALYLAGVAAAPLSGKRRLLAALAAAPAFFGLGVTRLFVLTLPTALVPEHGVAMHAFYQVVAGVALVCVVAWSRRADPLFARCAQALGAAGAGAVAGAALAAAVRGLASGGHLGHGYVDAQGALLVLPAVMTGVWAGLWWALDRPASWIGLLRGWLVLVVLQALTAITLGEAHAHLGAEVPIVLIRAVALLGPAVLAGWLSRPRHPVPAVATPGASAALS